MSDEPAQRDFWSKLQIILIPIGGLFTALAVAMVGIIGSGMIDRRQTADTNARLYSEIMSKREESETSLRKDMLVSVIQSYLQPTSKELGTRVLNIELLAYNFNDSINLKPLFLDLARNIHESTDEHAPEYKQRLQRVAREIALKQSLPLESRGALFVRQVDFDELVHTKKGTIALEPETVVIDGTKSEIALRVLSVNPVDETMRLRMQVKTARPGAEALTTSVVFDVGFYDFPMIDSTRLGNGQRCAVTLRNFSAKDNAAQLATVCFPGEFASLKDRPYYDEVLRQLKQVQAD